jgi:hypothetical protein
MNFFPKKRKAEVAKVFENNEAAPLETKRIKANDGKAVNFIERNK